ncbi:MAG: hypothetical protein IT406_01720 [Candidatus Yanofskybacteria bacterium]|nr:hypothetical protein [Candidatus Yanofskybacteria bacterium]
MNAPSANSPSPHILTGVMVILLAVTITLGLIWGLRPHPTTPEPSPSPLQESPSFSWGSITLTAPAGWYIAPIAYRTPAQAEQGEAGEVVGFQVLKNGKTPDTSGLAILNAGGPQSDALLCTDVPGRACARYEGRDALRFALWTADSSRETTDVFRAIASQLATTGSVSYAAAYDDVTYGLRVQLPGSWIGFKVQREAWHAVSMRGDSPSIPVADGPELHITHPLSTATSPRQDIPIMVFTIEQWKHIQSDEWSVSAAPFQPGELARNAAYVFAIPARYNYAFPPGFEEVEQLLREGAVSAR